MTAIHPGVTFADVEAAAVRIAPFVHRTPIMRSHTLDTMFSCELVFKCENFQRGGAFKARGAHNTVHLLRHEEARRGVVTHSSGNHAAALALAAASRGIAARIVMPSNAPDIKKRAVAAYGGKIVECAPTLPDREATAERIRQQTGATLVHPYNDERIIAGQGTAALELIADGPELDLILAPVGGGGLLAGTSIAAGAANVDVYGVEPEQADDAARSLRTGILQPVGNPDTIADGLRTALGDRTFAIIQSSTLGIATVSEAAIVAAMRLLWERLKIVVEASAAVPVAALIEKKLKVTDRRVGIILSGGNVDLARLPWLDGEMRVVAPNWAGHANR